MQSFVPSHFRLMSIQLLLSAQRNSFARHSVDGATVSSEYTRRVNVDKAIFKNVHAETQQICTAYDHVYEIFQDVHDDVKNDANRNNLVFSCRFTLPAITLRHDIGLLGLFGRI